jgi:putative ABC transport system ATP-binding protein
VVTSGSGKTTAEEYIGARYPQQKVLYTLTVKLYHPCPETACRAAQQKNRLRFKNFNLLGRHTAREYVEMPRSFRGRAALRRRKAEAALERVGLATAYLTSPRAIRRTSSRGRIARAIVTEPSVFHCGELRQSRYLVGPEILDLLISLNLQGTTVVLITHDMQIASRGNRMITLSDGRITA